MQENYERIREITSQLSLETFIKANDTKLNKYEWHMITKNPAFNLKIAEKYSEQVDWTWISVAVMMDEGFMKKFLGLLDLYAISIFQPLTYNFIKENKDILSMDKVVVNENVIKLNEYSEIKNMYEEMRLDQAAIEVWTRNMRDAKVIKPSPVILEQRIREYYDFIEKDREYKECGQTKIKEDESLSRYVEEVLAEILAKKVTEKPVEVEVALPNFNKMSKTELQEYVKARGIRVYYHDTIPMLKEKAIQKIGKE